jgi:sialic acid synthase SpsE
MGSAVAVAAVALGACIVEKHLTLRRSDGGPDAAFSMEPDEFREMTEAIRTVERALGRVNYHVTEREAASRMFRRSLFVVRDIKAGEVFSRDNVKSIRPGMGLAVSHLERILGKRSTADLERGTPLTEGHVGMAAEPGEAS